MRRAPAILVLCAWLLASGTQWDLAQSFAWVRMIANYSRTMSFDDAVRLTFTPGNLCDLCRFVEHAREQVDADKANAGAIPGAGKDVMAKGKVLLAEVPEYVFVFTAPRATEPLPDAESMPHSRGRPEPPTEPPRAA